MVPLLFVLVGGALSCAPGAALRRPPADPLVAELDREIAGQGAVAWSDRLLSWNEFQAPPPTAIGDRGAETAYTLYHAARCTGDRFEFRVVAAVLPSRSWVAALVRRDHDLSTRTLRHEQTHFDLTEVHARRLRRHLTDLYQPCARSEIELDGLAVRFMDDEAAAQRQYDEETSHGRLQARQLGWDADVARQLLALAQYVDRPRGEARMTRRFQ